MLYISELSPHKASSSTSTHFTDLIPDKPTSGMFNVDLDDNSDSLECVDLIPDKPAGGLFNIKLDDSSDSPESVDLMGDKATGGLFSVEPDNSDAHECVGLEQDKATGRLFNIELDYSSDSQERVGLMPDKTAGGLFNVELDNSDSHESVGLESDKTTGGLFNIELDENSDSQEHLDLVPDKAAGGLFNIELDDNSDSGECVDLMLDKPTGRLVTIELDDNEDESVSVDSHVAFPVSTFVNCANVDDSIPRNEVLQYARAPLTEDDRLSNQPQNTSQTSVIECSSPAVLPQQGSTAMSTEGSDRYSQVGRTELQSGSVESNSPAMNFMRGSSSLHSGSSSPAVHTTYININDESQTQVVIIDQDTLGNAITDCHCDTVEQVICAAGNVDNSGVGGSESNTDKHLSKSNFCRQQVNVAEIERTQNTAEANIPGKPTSQRDGPSTVDKSDNSVREFPLITSSESEMVTVTWSVPLNPVDAPVVESPRYRCTQCKYTCTRENLLKDHRAKVHGEKDLFKCSRCSYNGQLFKHLQKHMSRQHNIQLSSSKPVEERQGKIPNSNIKKVPKKERVRPGNKTPSIHGPRPTQYKRQPIGTKIKILDENTKEKLLSMISKYNWNLPINKWTGSIKLVSILKPQSSAGNRASGETKKSEKSKLFYCDQCDKTFKQKRSFEGHMNVHRGRFPFECADCDKSFSCKNSLRQHEKTHSTVRGHHCTEQGCRKSFRTKSR